MRIAGEHHGEGAYTRTRSRIFGQKGRLWMRFVEPFDDGQGLGDYAAVSGLKRRHQTLRIEVQVIGRALLALAQVIILVFRRQPLKVQRDADAVARRAAEIAVQFHCAALALFSSVCAASSSASFNTVRSPI